MNAFAPGAVLLLATSMSLAQLSFDNPKHLNLPEDKARLLLRMSCREVAHQLHLRKSSVPEFEMHLVLGEDDEHFFYDEKTGVPTLSLHEWNDQKFVTAAIRFAVEWSVSMPEQKKLILDVLHRSEQAAPVSAAQLQNSVTPDSRLPVVDGKNCGTPVSDASTSGRRCDGFHGPQRY